MKNIWLAILVWIMSTVTVWGDDAISENISTQLHANSKHMVSMGVKAEDALKLQNCFQERHMVRVRNMLQSAKDQKIPLKPIVDKALEGIAKKVNEKNIVRAMEMVRNRYAAAREEAGKLTREPALRRSITRTMVQAMKAGASTDDMSEIASQVRTRQRTMTRAQYEELVQHTFASARDMARLGLSSNNAKNIVTLALQKQYSAYQMKMLGHKFKHHSFDKAPGTVARYFTDCLYAGEKIGWQMSAGSGRTHSSSSTGSSGGSSGGSGGSSSSGGGSSSGSSGGNGGGRGAK